MIVFCSKKRNKLDLPSLVIRHEVVWYNMTKLRDKHIGDIFRVLFLGLEGYFDGCAYVCMNVGKGRV